MEKDKSGEKTGLDFKPESGNWYSDGYRMVIGRYFKNQVHMTTGYYLSSIILPVITVLPACRRYRYTPLARPVPSNTA